MLSRRRRWTAITAVGVAALLLSGCLKFDADRLGSDAAAGRNNSTPGSTFAQDHLITYLSKWGYGANTGASGLAAFKQPFTGGTNIIGIIPGTDLADEYVVVGAHYDGLGSSCRDLDPADSICNGATDNGTGVAAALAVGRALVLSPTAPRRSVVLAFWDREEDGLLGSKHFLANPLVPLEDVVSYVNFDIQGANLRASLRDVTFAIGAETGGARLQEMVAAASGPSTLDTRALSQIFGQGRSDHAPFIGAGIPTVFFSDSTGPCYHTDMDDPEIIDHTKLERQVGTATRLVRELANTSSLPTFQSGLPLATYDDAVAVSEVAHIFAELDDLPADVRDEFLAHREAVTDVVFAGPEAFDAGAITTVLVAAADMVDALTHGPCDGFLAST
jgi:hypothetical protein